MLINIYREKLLNAILFFAKEVKYPSRVKMFKLLYFLDFLHFKQTGRPVTNLQYYAWDFGPVPKVLFEELNEKSIPEDLRFCISIEPYKTNEDRQGYNFKPKKNADLTVFSPREKKLLEELAFIFKEAKPNEMSELSHLQNEPWDKTVREKGRYQLIDYLLALDSKAMVTKEEATEITKEREELFKNYPLKQTAK